MYLIKAKKDGKVVYWTGDDVSPKKADAMRFKSLDLAMDALVSASAKFKKLTFLIDTK